MAGLIAIRDSDGDFCWAQVAMKVELGTDHGLGPHDRPHASDQVFLAVVIALGYHRSVQLEQHDIDRHRGPRVGQHLLPQPLIGRFDREAARFRPGHETEDEVMPAFPSLLSPDLGQIKGRVAGRPGDAVLSPLDAKVLKGGRDRRKVLVSVAKAATKVLVECASANAPLEVIAVTQPASLASPAYAITVTASMFESMISRYPSWIDDRRLAARAMRWTARYGIWRPSGWASCLAAGGSGLGQSAHDRLHAQCGYTGSFHIRDMI